MHDLFRIHLVYLRIYLGHFRSNLVEVHGAKEVKNLMDDAAGIKRVILGVEQDGTFWVVI